MGYRKRCIVSRRSKSIGGRRSIQTRVNSSGYQQFKDPNTGKWMYMHRRVAEKKLGGKIGPGREVHHIDGNKTNNRPSNLTVLSKAKHRHIHGKKNKK